MIKKIEKDEYTLIHKVYIDEYGIERNAFDFYKTREDGTIIHYPFFGNIRIKTENPIYEDTSEYTEEEYMEMIEDRMNYIIR